MPPAFDIPAAQANFIPQQMQRCQEHKKASSIDLWIHHFACSEQRGLHRHLPELPREEMRANLHTRDPFLNGLIVFALSPRRSETTYVAVTLVSERSLDVEMPQG